MKKIVSLLLAAVLLLGLTACGHTHIYGDWSVTAEANCTTDGMQERVCECGEKETQVIPAGAHKFDEGTVLAEVTCTEDGKVEKTCTLCGEKQEEVVAATGHSFKAATAFAPKTCSGCGLQEGEALSKVVTTGDVIEAEDHKFTVGSASFVSSLKEKKGNITYTKNDGYMLAIKLDFTNLATEAFDRWNSERVTDVSLEYGGKFKYEGEYWVPADDIVPLANGSMYIAYSVPESMGEDAESSIYATFTIDGEVYSMVVQEGGAVGGQDQTQEKSVDGVVAIGDTRTDGENFAFELKDIYYTDKPSEKQGNVTYTRSVSGRSLLLKLKFTNLSTEALDDWGDDRISDMKLVYADKYEYQGDSWVPAREIVPLADGNVYILFEVSDAVENGTEALVATFTVDGCEFTVDCRK